MVAPVPPLVAVAGVECHGASFGVSADVKCYNLGVKISSVTILRWRKGNGRVLGIEVKDAVEVAVCVSQASAHKYACTHARTRTHTHLLIFLIPVNNEVH